MKKIANISEIEENLLTRYQKTKDQNLIGNLYSQYMHLVYGLCLKYLKNREDAQDAVMGIYEKVSKELLTKNVVHFKSWLYMVSKNYCLMELRKQHPEINTEVFMEIPEDMHLYNDTVSIEKDLNALEKCIEELKDEQQNCIRLFYLEKKSYSEVSNRLNMAMQQVKSHIQNGKRNLKTCLETYNVSK